MSNLEKSILEMGLVSKSDLDEANARRSIYGGDITTSLLELRATKEGSLLRSIARFYGLEPVPAGSLSVQSSKTRLLLGAGIEALVLRSPNGATEVAVTRPLERAAREQAEIEIGRAFMERACLPVRFEEARAVVTGTPLEPRWEALLNELGHRPPLEPGPSSGRPEPVLPARVEFEDTPFSEHGTTAPPPVDYEQIALAAAQEEAPSSRGGLDWSTGDQLPSLKTARTTDEVAAATLEIACRVFRFAACFAIQRGEARGLFAQSRGRTATPIHHVSVALDLPGSFERAVTQKVPLTIRTKASGLDRAVLTDLGRIPGTEILLTPVLLRKRPVLLLWLDRGSDGIDSKSISSSAALARGAARSLERVILEKKRSQFAAYSKPPSAPPVPVSAHRLPPVEGREIVTLVGAPELVGGDPGDIPIEVSAAPSHSIAPPSAGSSTGAVTPPLPELTSSFPFEGRHLERSAEFDDKNSNALASLLEASIADAQGTHESVSVERRPLSDSKDGESPSDPPKTLRGFPKGGEVDSSPRYPESPRPLGPSAFVPLHPRRMVRLSGPPVAGETSDGAPPSNTILSQDLAEGPETPAPFARRSEAPPPPRAPSMELPASADVLHPHAFDAPSGRTVLDPSMGASAKTMLSRKPFDDEAPPEALWDEPLGSAPLSRAPLSMRSNGYLDLVERLGQGDESVLERLIDGGETAVAALITIFPGEVSDPPGASTRASECGPVLRALVALGRKSVPFLTVRTRDESAHVRRWATFALGELPGKEAAEAIAARLLDGSPIVRRAALASARRMGSDMVARRALRSAIEKAARDLEADPDTRSASIEALADIRESDAIPALLDLLGDEDKSVKRAAKWALTVLTRQDFGHNRDAWFAFWQAHRDEDRFEWLITALDHESADLRRAAGDELSSLTDETFGFQSQQPAHERREVQAKYRRWYADGGKSRLDQGR